MTPEQLEARRKGIGGSDVAAILGMSKWATPLQVYRDKRGELPPTPDTAPMYWGRAMEPLIAQWYADTTGNTVTQPGLIQHTDFPWALANTDGIVNDAGILEVKTSRYGHDFGTEGTDQIPRAYVFQVQHYMWITGLKWADVAVLIGGNEPRIYTVQADPELHELVAEALANFWDHVVRGVPPEPRTWADVQERFPATVEKAHMVKIADAEAMETARELAALKAQIKVQEAVAKQLQADLCRAMGELPELKTPGGSVLATWKAGKPPQQFDKKAFGTDHPDLLKKYTTTGTASRRFLLRVKHDN